MNTHAGDTLGTGKRFLVGSSGLRMRELDAASTALAMLGALSDGLLFVDREWRLAYMNPAACRVFAAHGWDPAALIGRHLWDELFPGSRGSEAARQWFRTMHERLPARFEDYRAPWKKWYELRLYPTSDGGIVNMFRDITASKQEESVLREHDAALQEADRRKDEFLATLAHELRNPLGPLRHGLQVMKLARGNAEILEQAREMMERQVGHMVALVDDLLDLSRISRGQMSMHKERIDLASVVSAALDTCEATIRAAHQELSVSLPREPVWVHGDSVRLAQVLTNLLGNASKYSNAGGRISLTLEARDGGAWITVSDTGIGIPADMLSRVFDMFSQVDGSTERAQKGLGIGLTVVKRLVEMHGGTVEARSEGRDRGSQFIVRLPVSAAGPEEALDERPAPGAPAGGRRVLVVDDNRDAAFTLAMMLRLMGNTAEIAHDGRAAVELGEAFRPDLILMDIGMPGVSGYAAAQLVRGRPWGRDARLVAVTGLGRDSDRRASREAGFDDHLVKPVEPDALASLLASPRS